MTQNNNNKFRHAIKLLENENFNEAIICLKELLESSTKDNHRINILLLLGKAKYDLKDYNKALKYFYEAQLIQSNSELASLCKYLSYVELNRHDDALNELFNFLERYPADMYITTLGELKEQIDEGDDFNSEINDKLNVLFKQYNI